MLICSNNYVLCNLKCIKLEFQVLDNKIVEKKLLLTLGPPTLYYLQHYIDDKIMNASLNQMALNK